MEGAPMKPTIKLAETTAPDGANFSLYEHDGEFTFYLEKWPVMSTKMTYSELMLADLGCQWKDGRTAVRILIGGLGLGFTLRRCLEINGPKAVCEVAEILPDVIKWNHELLNGLNDEILADRRTLITRGDVYDCIKRAADGGPKYDAILLDVDDGPSSLIQPQNWQLYGGSGLSALQRALTKGGRAAFWAAEAEPKLMKSLRKAGFHAEEVAVAGHERTRKKIHRIYVAEMPV